MKQIVFFLLCVLSQISWSQDERFYRNMFNGLLQKGQKPIPYKIKVFSPKYMIDLNRDGINESFQAVKKDGVDFIRINDAYGEKLCEHKIESKGAKSRIFKANFVKVNKNVDVLVLHFYEGEIDVSTYESSARLYFVTILNGKLASASLTKGPYFWNEKEKRPNQYWNRKYTVNFVDYNKDGQKEISVNYHNISKIFYYSKNGIWESI